MTTTWEAVQIRTGTIQCAGWTAVSLNSGELSKEEIGNIDISLAGDAQTWIRWDNSASAWQCCGDDGCDGTPTDETFNAISPARYSAVPSVPTSASSAAVTSSKSSGHIDDQDNGLSAGTIGGIAAGVAGGVIAVLTAIIVPLWIKRRNASKQRTLDEKWQETYHHRDILPHYRHDEDGFAYAQQDVYSKRNPATPQPMSYQELPSRMTLHELPSGDTTRWELPNGDEASRK